jgi:hypothetical protein
MKKQALAERHIIAHLNMLATYHEALAATNTRIAETYKALVPQVELLLGGSAQLPALAPPTPTPAPSEKEPTSTHSMNGTLISAIRGALAKHRQPVDICELHILLGGAAVLSRSTLSGTLSRCTGVHWTRSGERGSYRYSPLR